MTDYAIVLNTLYPDALWGLTDNDLSTLTWAESNADGMPSQADLDAAWPAVQTERAWAVVRAERDRLLTACDWTQVADAPVDPAPWAAYRQTLRDIPQDFDSPDDVIWPEAP